jgi:hypothetical protein
MDILGQDILWVYYSGPKLFSFLYVGNLLLLIFKGRGVFLGRFLGAQVLVNYLFLGSLKKAFLEVAKSR